MIPILLQFINDPANVVYLPFSVISLLHIVSAALITLTIYHQRSLNELQSFFMFCLMSVGGGSSVAFLLGKTPLVFANSFAIVNLALIYYSLRFFKIHTPKVFKNVTSMRHISVLFKVIDTISSVSTTVSSVRLLKANSNAGLAGAVALGVLGAIGGGIISDAIGWKVPGQTLFSNAAIAKDMVKYALVAVCVYVYIPGISVKALGDARFEILLYVAVLFVTFSSRSRAVESKQKARNPATTKLRPAKSKKA